MYNAKLQKGSIRVHIFGYYSKNKIITKDPFINVVNALTSTYNEQHICCEYIYICTFT